MHIHTGAAGVNGPVTVDSGLSGNNNLPRPAGRSTFVLNGTVAPDNANGLATLNGMISNPAGYYFNIHSTVNPGGVMRGQLMPATAAMFFGLMSSDTEVPVPTNVGANGVGQVFAIVSRDAAGKVTSAEFSFTGSYRFPAPVTITGYHIHPGVMGENGPVAIGSQLPARTDSRDSGFGAIPLTTTQIPLDIPLDNAMAIGAIDMLFSEPHKLYVNLHTSDNPGGVIRSQLVRAASATFRAQLSPGKAVPAGAVPDASGAAVVTVYWLGPRDTMTAAAIMGSVNYRFPGKTGVSGVFLMDGPADMNGGLSLPFGLANRPASPVVLTNGFGNGFFSGTYSDAATLTTIKDIIANPGNHYLVVRSTDNGDVLRDQLSRAQ
jgi:hypothetical protein